MCGYEIKWGKNGIKNVLLFSETACLVWRRMLQTVCVSEGVFNSTENLGYLKKNNLCSKDFKISCLFKKHKQREGKGEERWVWECVGSGIAERHLFTSGF